MRAGENEIHGEHKRRSGRQLTYTYTARWEQTGDGYLWRATITRDGTIRAEPSGYISLPHRGFEPDKAVRDAIAAAIENLREDQQ